MRRGWIGLAVVGVAAGALLWGNGGPEAAQRVARAPGPADPLTPQEIATASQAATSGFAQHMAAGSVDLLYVERVDDKAVAGRQAEAYLYDYAHDRLIVRTVDLGTARVVAERAGSGRQAPPSQREELRAAQLLLADPRLGPKVRDAYAKAASRALGSAADLHVQGLIYPRKPCEAHRCLQVFIRFPDGRWLDTSRIVVDLSAKKIVSLEW
jgi:hypothetical protein